VQSEFARQVWLSRAIPPALKLVGSNGQISLDQQSAGRHVLVEESEPGISFHSRAVSPVRRGWAILAVPMVHSDPVFIEQTLDPLEFAKVVADQGEPFTARMGSDVQVIHTNRCATSL
jgi:hypothetical protein